MTMNIPNYSLNIDLSAYSFLVTGGAGFIGSHLVEYLLQHGAKRVRVLDNFSTGSRSNTDLFALDYRYELIEGDIRQPDTCHIACRDIDFVLHQAALGSVPRSVKDPIATNEVNVSGFVNMLHACRLADIKRVVYASSSAVYGDEPTLPKIESRIGKPLSPYAVSKLANEIYADVFMRCYGIEIIGLRYFNVFGERQSPEGLYAAVIPLFIEGLRQQKEVFINGDGEQSRDFTYVANAVQANIKALFAPVEATGKVYNIAAGQRYTINQLYNVIANLLGSTQKPIHRAVREGDIPHSLANIDLARHWLNYEPQIALYEGLEKMLKTFT